MGILALFYWVCVILLYFDLLVNVQERLISTGSILGRERVISCRNGFFSSLTVCSVLIVRYFLRGLTTVDDLIFIGGVRKLEVASDSPLLPRRSSFQRSSIRQMSLQDKEPLG